MALPPFIAGGTTNTPTILNEMSGLYRPTASNADLDRLYATGALIYAMTNYRADNLALVKWVVKDQQGNVVPGGDELGALITPDVIRRSEISLCFRGYNLLWKRRNRVSDRVTALRWMNFNMYQADKHWNLGLLGFRVYANSTTYQPVEVNYIPLEDSIYFHYIDLNDDFDGVSPVEASFMSAGIDVEIPTTVLAFFQNMAIPTLWVQPAENSPQTPSKDERDDLIATLRRIAKGVINAGRTLVTPSRWDIRELQTKFEDLAMPELTTTARESVSIAMRVPLPLVLPTEGNYAQTYEAQRGWVQRWLIPQAYWYASHFTEQLIAPINPGWRVEPDFVDVPGQKDDEARRIEAVNAQVQGGYLTLFEARQKMDLPDDPTLKGLYMIGGKPVPVTALPTYWEQQPQAGTIVGFNPPSLPTPKLGASRGEAPALPSGAGKSMTPDTWLPDAQYREWRDWRNLVARKGVDYPFAAKSLSVETVEFGKRLLDTGYDVDDAFVAIKAHAAVGVKSVTAKKPAYVSLKLAPEAVKQVQSYANTIKPLIGPVKEWQDPDTYHLTLCYVEDVSDGVLAQVMSELPSDLPAALFADHSDWFEDNGDGYPVHLVVNMTTGLQALQQQVAKAFEKHSVVVSPHSQPEQYHPHVTLGYVSAAPPTLPLPATPFELPVKSLEVGRDNYRTIKTIPASKSAIPLKPVAAGFGTPTEPDVYATEAEANEYWKDFDNLADEIRNDWLHDYMARAWETLKPRIQTGISNTEVLSALGVHHPELVASWIGSLETPGPLLKIAIAGLGAGNRALELHRAANPKAAKAAIGLSVSFDLVQQEALDWLKTYGFDLIRGIDQTTADLVRESLDQSIAEGLPQEAMAKALDGIFHDMARSRLISQSESNRIFNNGAFTRWGNAGVFTAKWRTVNDPRVCDLCKRLNGQVADFRTGWIDPLTQTAYKDSAHAGDRCFRSPQL